VHRVLSGEAGAEDRVTRRLNCPMCRKGEVRNHVCDRCGWVDEKGRKMYEAMEKHG